MAVFHPPGFAHGFATLEDDTVFHYLCTNLYHPESEGALLWNDPDLGIDWGLDAPLVSDKDAQAEAFATFESLIAVICTHLKSHLSKKACWKGARPLAESGDAWRCNL